MSPAAVAALPALPTSSDQSAWNEEERALIEAAGLVHVDTRGKEKVKTLAPRPTVAAFLRHCAKTGLDPIARQIYCLPRWSHGELKWQIQVSIDGARLVAERSREYEGQTTPEFTADGVAWTEVWLAKEPPRAARVGVYRRGFRDALYAVALWDAYVQRTRSGDVTEMWGGGKGPLMLAKCAEMLALRKAFPQDLSGLYVREELDHDSTDAHAAVEADAAHAAVEAAAPAWSADELNAFLLRVAQETDIVKLRALYDEADAAGTLGLATDSNNTTVSFLIHERRRELEAPGRRPAASAPAPDPEPESVPATLDVDGGASS